MNLRPRIREKSEPHTSTLNDILFILLFFFLVVATLANPNVIKLAIPKAKSDTKAKQTVAVSIDAKQQFYVGPVPVAADSLQQRIGMELAKNHDTEQTVVINADKQATAESVVAVMRAAQALKVRTVLAVDKSE